MQSLRVSSMRRLCSAAASLRLAPRAKPLPALLSGQFFSTSPLVRAGFDHRTERNQRNEYRTDRSSSRTIPAPFPPSPTLYISNLPWEATAKDVETAFEEFGGVQKISFGVLPDGRSRGYAHVLFTSEEQATAVYDAHRESPFSFGEREININYGSNPRREGEPPAQRGFKKDLEPSPSLYIGSIPYSATEQDIRTALGGFGEISSIRIGRDNEGTSKGFAHVDFISTAEAERVLEHYKSQSVQIQDRDIRIDRAAPPASAHPPSPRVYFKGFIGEESELRGSLGDFSGQVRDIVIMKHPQTGAPSGAGFIQFESIETATQAMQALNGTSLTEGVRFELAFAKPRSANAPRGERGTSGRFGLKSHRGGSEEGGYSRRSGGSHGMEWGNNRSGSGTWGGRQ